MSLWGEQYARAPESLIPNVQHLLQVASTLLEDDGPMEHYVDRYEIHYVPGEEGYEEVADLRTLGYWKERLREQVSLCLDQEPARWAPQSEQYLDFLVAKVGSMQDQASRYKPRDTQAPDLRRVGDDLTTSIEASEALIERLESQQTRELRQEYEQAVVPEHLRELIAKRVQWLDMDFTGVLEELAHVTGSAQRVREELTLSLTRDIGERDIKRLCEMGQMMAHRLSEFNQQMQVVAATIMQTVAEQLNPDTWAEMVPEESPEE